MNKTTKAVMIVGAVPAGISLTWLAARAWNVMVALFGVITIVTWKAVLIGVAAALGMAFAHFADAQGNAGFIYARDAAGADRLVVSNIYQDLTNFGNDLLFIGRAYDGGARATLYSANAQAYIQYAFTANATNPGKDLLQATLDARNYNPSAPSVTEVFVGSFGGTMIGETAGTMFGSIGLGGMPRGAQPVQQY